MQLWPATTEPFTPGVDRSINPAGQVDGLGTITTETPTGSYSTFQAYLYSNGSFSIVSPSSIECPVTVQDTQEFPENYSAGLPAQYDIRGIGPQGQLLGTTTLDPTEYGPGGFIQNQGQLLFCLTDAMVLSYCLT